MIKTERIKILKARKPGKEFQVYFSDPELGPIEVKWLVDVGSLY